MTALTYTTGNPTNLTAGATASMNDIQGPFTDIRTFLSSTNIDYSNIAAVVQSQYQVVERYTAQASGLTAGTFVFHAQAGLVATSGAAAAQGAFYLDSAEFPSGTRTPKLRIAVSALVNNTAPAISYTYGLYPVATSVGGAATNAVTLSAVVAGSTCTITTPAANSITNHAETAADFTFPTAGHYILGVVPSGSETANASLIHKIALKWRPV